MFAFSEESCGFYVEQNRLQWVVSAFRLTGSLRIALACSHGELSLIMTIIDEAEVYGDVSEQACCFLIVAVVYSFFSRDYPCKISFSIVLSQDPSPKMVK